MSTPIPQTKKNRPMNLVSTQNRLTEQDSDTTSLVSEIPVPSIIPTQTKGDRNPPLAPVFSQTKTLTDRNSSRTSVSSQIPVSSKTPPSSPPVFSRISDQDAADPPSETCS